MSQPVSAAESKAAIAALERELAALDLVTSAIEAGGARVVLRKPRSAEALICEEDFAGDERLPYWADVWPSSRALAGTIRGEAGAGRSLLELGCGVGLVSLTALRAGFDVTATDYYHDALRVARLNAMRLVGDGDARLRTRYVDWRALPDDLGRHDVVCAADVLYEREYAELVAHTIDVTLAPGGVAMVADPGRSALAPFREQMRARGFREGEALTVLVPSDDASGSLVQKARPGGAGIRPAAPGLPAAHRVTVYRFTRAADAQRVGRA